MEAIRHLAHCGRCGAPAGRQTQEPGGPFRCPACGFTLFFNAAAAVGLVLQRQDGQALFIRRAKEPAKGKLGLPGGFASAGEGAEQALAREVREEVGLEIRDVRYLSSHANQYFYEGVTYHTLDVFFTGEAEEPQSAKPLDEVKAIEWHNPMTVPLEELAFDSMRAALEVFRSRRGRE